MSTEDQFRIISRLAPLALTPPTSMQKKSAKKAIKDTLQVDLSEKDAQELYLNICNYLLHNDDKCYISVIRYKYLLLCGEISTAVSDYLVMEQLIEKMQSRHSLVLSAITYIAKYKS
jgi:hypothetical protein